MKTLLILLLLTLILGGCATVQVTHVVGTADNLGQWFVLTDPQGHDHILFCEAKTLHVANAEEPAACYDLTPRGNGPVGAVGVPLRSTTKSGP